MRRPARSSRSPREISPAAARCCRCMSCSRTRPGGSRAPRADPAVLSRSDNPVTTFEPGARLVFTQGFVLSPRSTAFFADRPAATITDGFDVFVQLVIAAITTAPSRSVNSCPSTQRTLGRRCVAVTAPTTSPPSPCQRPHFGRRWRGAGSLKHQSSASRKRRLHLRKRDAILRAARSGHARLDVPRSSSSVSEYSASGESFVWKRPCSFMYASTSLQMLLCTARELQVIERLLIDREDAAGRAIFRRHVSRSSRDRQGRAT